VLLAKGHIYHSQGHRPWSMNLDESVWPTAIFKLQALKLNMAVGQSLTSFFRTRGVAPGYVEKRPLANNKNSETLKDVSHGLRFFYSLPRSTGGNRVIFLSESL